MILNVIKSYIDNRKNLNYFKKIKEKYQKNGFNTFDKNTLDFNYSLWVELNQEKLIREIVKFERLAEEKAQLFAGVIPQFNIEAPISEEERILAKIKISVLIDKDQLNPNTFLSN